MLKGRTNELVDFTPLLLLMLAAATSILAAVITIVRRWLRLRRVRRLYRESTLVRELEALVLPGRIIVYIERVALIAGVASFGFIAWGFHEPNTLGATVHHLAFPKLRGERPIRIIQLSDLHSEAEVHLEDEVIRSTVALQPDLIVFTGDAINHEAALPVFQRTMRALSRIAPTFAIRGNWETWWFPGLDLYGNTGVTKLDGRAQEVIIRGQRFWLVGVGVDREHELPRAMAQVPQSSFKILLAHFPSMAPAASKAGIDLMLSGDTHGGQIWLPLIGESLRIKRGGYWKPWGLHREGTLWFYVNRGIGEEGNAPRFRFACRPEIAVFELDGS